VNSDPNGLARLEVFTTGQVARIARCSVTTIKKCLIAGRLRGYKLPLLPGQQRSSTRITRDALRRFLREHGLSVPPWLECGRRCRRRGAQS
jgi:hypothetical protein